MTDPSAVGVDLAPGGFRAGDVITRTFGIFGRNWVQYSLLVGIATLPNLYFQFETVGAKPQDMTPAFAIMLSLGVFVSLFLTLIAQAVVTHASFQDMRDRPIDLGESLRRGFGRFLPILGIVICVSLMAMVGFILLFVPGLMVLTATIVAVPACVVERLGPIASIRRSMALTKGERWRVFGIMVAVFIVAAMVAGTVEVSLMAALPRVIAIPFLFVWSAVSGSIAAILYVVMYHDLRVAREGLDTDRIAAVFD